MTPLWEAYILFGDSLCCLDAISNQLESTTSTQRSLSENLGVGSLEFLLTLVGQTHLVKQLELGETMIQ